MELSSKNIPRGKGSGEKLQPVDINNKFLNKGFIGRITNEE
jgi:hypothetical protein